MRSTEKINTLEKAKKKEAEKKLFELIHLSFLYSQGNHSVQKWILQIALESDLYSGYFDIWRSFSFSEVMKNLFLPKNHSVQRNEAIIIEFGRVTTDILDFIKRNKKIKSGLRLYIILNSILERDIRYLNVGRVDYKRESRRNYSLFLNLVTGKIETGVGLLMKECFLEELKENGIDKSTKSLLSQLEIALSNELGITHKFDF